MTMNLKREENESVDEFILRAYEEKKNRKMTWQQFADLLNPILEISKSETFYRRRIQNSAESIQQYQKGKSLDFNFTDLLTQTNADIRRISREETIKEIAKSYAEKMSSKKILPEPLINKTAVPKNKEAILCLSDWHYGIEVDSHFNQFNPDICKERIALLLDRVVDICSENNISKIKLLNLGDLICGRIHLTLRLQSRIDTITQIMDVSEILAEAISHLTARGIRIDYYDCLDNHSRVEPKKRDSLQLESLQRIIPWYLENRLKMNPLFKRYPNEFGEDIVTFECLGHSVAAVHGDKDRPGTAIQQLSLFTGRKYELVLTAHNHHFGADEENQTILVSNGTLMGADAYALDLRKVSTPSQNLIIATEGNIIEDIKRIVLN